MNNYLMKRIMYACFIFSLFQGIYVSAFLCEKVNRTASSSIFVECTTLCYAVWYNNTGNISVVYKDCWYDSASKDIAVTKYCDGRTRIRENDASPTMCYCTSPLCNVNLTWVGNVTEHNEHPTPSPGTKATNKSENDQTILFAIVAVLTILVVFLVLLLLYLKRRSILKSDPESMRKNSEFETLIPAAVKLPPIDLKDVLSQGQFCMVRKGRMGHKEVAVKIFPITQGIKPTPSALTEKDIYTDCKLQHENILKFIGEHHHDEGNQRQLWLVTEYIDQGSLSDFLKRNTVSLDNLLHMAHGMALGMAYLHVEIPKVKPSIAHRDIKSKNILVKNNLTCCISDFGLSLKFDDEDGPGDTHGQVGTRRYMSPEVLEGAINFSREAFLRIDMYAFALCLWEILNRCTAVQEEAGDYKLPFESEVGIHPTLEELQDYVVNKKQRPRFEAEWKGKDQAIDAFIVTIEECWDHDADARLTADCVAERVKQLCIEKRHALNTAVPLSVSFKTLAHENDPLA